MSDGWLMRETGGFVAAGLPVSAGSPMPRAAVGAAGGYTTIGARPARRVVWPTTSVVSTDHLRDLVARDALTTVAELGRRYAACGRQAGLLEAVKRDNPCSRYEVCRVLSRGGRRSRHASQLRTRLSRRAAYLPNPDAVVANSGIYLPADRDVRP